MDANLYNKRIVLGWGGGLLYLCGGRVLSEREIGSTTVFHLRKGVHSMTDDMCDPILGSPSDKHRSAGPSGKSSVAHADTSPLHRSTMESGQSPPCAVCLFPRS